MSVDHFADYCRAFRFAGADDVKDHEEIQTERGSFYNSKRTFFYVKDKRRMQDLARQGNIYAKGEIDERNKTTNE